MASVETQTQPNVKVPPKPVAVIDIGTTSIRMAIAEIDENGGVRRLETLSQAVSLGNDTFTRGSISKETIETCVRILKDYRSVLGQYQISTPEQIRVVATSAVREASNQMSFLDRVFIATGIEVEPIDEVEVNRVTYLSILPLLQAEPALAAARTMIAEVGGGSTELLLVKNGIVTYSHTYRLGSLRLHQLTDTYRSSVTQTRTLLESQINRVVGELKEVVPHDTRTELIALGGDIRFAALHILPDWDRNSLARIPVVALEEFTNEILAISEDDVVRNYNVSYQEAETMGPALLVYVQLAKAMGLVNVIVSNTNLRDGLLVEMAVREAWTNEFRNQIIRSALDLGHKFHFDETHAKHVAFLCDQLFDQTMDQHELGPRFKLLLHTAALLHKIGMFVRNRSHHKHSMYLIQNSDLFGLNKRDMQLVAMTARYYRRASPKPNHTGYASLNRNERVAVIKMAAILRVAVALDETRSQRIQSFDCKPEKDRLIISVPNAEDISLEQLAIRQSCDIFEETFGLQVQLRSVQPT